MSHGTCKKCGCTDNNTCFSDIHGGCWWVDYTHELCSFCQESFASDNTIERPSGFEPASNIENPASSNQHPAMSDKKIFIALSQREARSVITAIDFLTDVCLPKSSDIFYEAKQKNAASIGITAEELSELFNFGFRLGELANEQAELEASIENPVSIIQS